MAYATNENVTAMCRNLLGGAEYFSTSTSPTLADVEKFLSSGCSILESNISAWGYNVPVLSTAMAYDWISDLNTLYAAARAEMTRINVTLSPGERTRGQVFEEMFWQGMERLSTQDLTSAGVEKSSTAGGKMYVGGISKADKALVESDTDRVTPKFRKGMWKYPDSLEPAGADSDTD